MVKITKKQHLKISYNYYLNLIEKLEEKWYNDTEFINNDINYDNYKSYHNKLIRKLDYLKGEIHKYEYGIL